MAATSKAGTTPQETTKGANGEQTPAPKPDAAAGGDAGKAGDKAGEGTGEVKPDAGAAGDAGKSKEESQDTKGGASKDESKAGAEGSTPKAPATYELTVPEESKRFVSDEDLSYFQEVARANDWTNEEAQAELSSHIERAQKTAQARIEGWEATTKADKTYGGKNLAETQRLGNTAIDRVFPKGHPMRDAFVGFLKESGGGVRLEVVAFLAELGRKMGEDTGGGGSASSGGGDRASKFYDHPTSKRAEEQAAKA